MLSALIISFSTDFPFSQLICISAGLYSYPTFLCLHGCVSLNVFVCLQKLWLLGARWVKRGHALTGQVAIPADCLHSQLCGRGP